VILSYSYWPIRTSPHMHIKPLVSQPAGHPAGEQGLLPEFGTRIALTMYLSSRPPASPVASGLTNIWKWITLQQTKLKLLFLPQKVNLKSTSLYLLSLDICNRVIQAESGVTRQSASDQMKFGTLPCTD
jgi:hypothetical protein